MSPQNSMSSADDNLEGSSPRTARILVVEDEALVCWSLSSILAKKGHTITVVTTGEDAVKQLSGNHYDLVITDLKLPHIDGFEVSTFVKKSQPGLPVIMISTEDNPSIADHLGRKVIDYFMEKPFDLDDMVSLIDTCLKQFRNPVSYETRR